MKQSTFVSDIALYDIVNVAGVAADLSHVETRPTVTGHTGPSELPAALSGATVVLIPAGVPRKPGNSRFFYINIVSFTNIEHSILFVLFDVRASNFAFSIFSNRKSIRA